MKHISAFKVLLTMVVLMIIGAALISKLDIANEPRPEQGKTLTVSYMWHGAAAKVVEQNVTSRIEALVSSVAGVESVSSVSDFGSGHVIIQLKSKTDVSAVKFEIASLLRQIRSKLPEEVSYPELSGGEVDTGRDDDVKQILSYQVNADMSDEQMRKFVEKGIKTHIERIDGVNHVEVTGGMSQYMELSYDARKLANYGIYANDIVEAVKNYAGREDVVGSVRVNGSQIYVPLLLSSSRKGIELEKMPVKTIDGRIVYMNNLVSCEIRQKKPDCYYRVNGMNTIYVNIYADKDVNIVKVSDKAKAEMQKLTDKSNSSLSTFHFLLINDSAKEQMSEFNTLVLRSSVTLLILLLFIWLSSGRRWKYLAIIGCTLMANILLSVIVYWILDIRLHPFSMAGITVSLGIIIDSAIVMVDHYVYYRNRKAFLGILAAMLTTIGSLVVVFWLPDSLRHDLKDFSVIVIVNLVIALLVALFFAPALVEQMHYQNKNNGRLDYARQKVHIIKFYRKYVHLTQHCVWRWVMLIFVAGAFAGSLKLFIDSLYTNGLKPKKKEIEFTIRAQMPPGGSVYELNNKVCEVEAFLSNFKQIKRYEAGVSASGAEITVEFNDDVLHTGFPYLLENKVIGKVITIGGADWSVQGVSDRVFSNSLNLQSRQNRIDIAGYDYDKLYRYAEDMWRDMRKNGRVTDIVIEAPGHERQEDELFMEYDRRALTLDSVNVCDIHNSMSSMLSEVNAGEINIDRPNGKTTKMDVIVCPTDNEYFDLWQLENSYIKVGDRDIRPSDFMQINHREAKNCISREKQEYVLSLAFNVLGSFTYTNQYINQITDKYNALFPAGFRCLNSTYDYYEDGDTQYLLIGLIAIIIFFVCAILLESLYQSMVIVMLIPTSLIGLFITYYITGVPFGTGGFAAMVMLSGLTVNAGIYIICEYRNIMGTQRVGRMYSYLHAFNHKIIPIFLTIFSTVIGMIPFIIDGADKQSFWYSLAIGTIGGLAFSIVPLILVMPMMMRLDPKRFPN